MAVDTTKVERRVLRFQHLDQVLAEVDRLAAAERGGTLVHTGNWTLGQSLGHLAYWASAAFTGLPLNVPWYIRLVVRLSKYRYLRGPLPAGVNIPHVEGGTLGIEPLAMEEGLRRYQQALERLAEQCPQEPNIFFGKLTHPQWIALNLRHAELHLGFMDIR